MPDGVELYIHEDDVFGESWFEALAARFTALAPPPAFTWVVEGPVWSLDGELFGIGRSREVDRELTRRLVRLAASLGAVAVNIHCVEGSPDGAVLSEAQRREALERSFPFLAWYVQLCRDAGLVPLIENVPPICRMRRAAFIYTPIGVEPRDLLDCVRAVPGLGLTLDTSHAQLAVNAFTGAEGADERRTTNDDENMARAVAYYRARGGPASLGEFIAPLLPWITGVHISNAAGLLAEGLPYDQGDADLDAAVRRLANTVRYFVTEPLDTDENTAPLKRQIQRRLAAVLGIPLSSGAPVSTTQSASK